MAYVDIRFDTIGIVHSETDGSFRLVTVKGIDVVKDVLYIGSITGEVGNKPRATIEPARPAMPRK